MLLESKTGIECDLCKSRCEDTFTYYSLDTMLNNTNVVSLDACLVCINDIIDKLKKYYDPTNTKCELSGKNLDTRYLCVMTKVQVDYTKFPPICKECSNVTCLCENKILVKKAAVFVDPEKVTVNICEATKEEFKKLERK